MQLAQGSRSIFRNPFKGSGNKVPYQMEDLELSETRNPNQQADAEVNGQNPSEVRSQDVTLEFPTNTYTEAPINAITSTADQGDNQLSTTAEIPSQNPVVPHRPNFEENKEMLINLREELGLKINLWNMISFLLCGLALVVIRTGMSNYLILLGLILVDIGKTVLMFFKNKRIGSKKLLLFALSMLSSVFATLFKINLFNRIWAHSFGLVPAVLFEMAFSIVSWHQHRMYIASYYHKLEIFFKFLISLQIALVTMKLDGFIIWGWREVFTIYWITLALAIGITFAAVLTCIHKCCTYTFGETEVPEFRTILWFFLMTTGFTVLSCSTIIQVIRILNDQSTFAAMDSLLITIAICNFGFGLLTYSYRTEMKEIFDNLLAINFNLAAEIAQEKLSPKKEPEKLDIPKFLTKFSSTYFRRATGDEVETAKNIKKAKEQKEKKKPAAPLPIKKRQNSVDYSKMKHSQISGNTTSYLNLLTVHETEGEKTKTTLENWGNTSRFGLRVDKGKDFLNSLTDRTGVSGIIPSGIITSKTDRYGFDGDNPLTSNDSYMLPPISKDTEAPFVQSKRRTGPPNFGNLDNFDVSNFNKQNESPFDNMDISPLDIPENRDPEDSFNLPTFKQHRRIQSLQHFPSVMSARAISLVEAIQSPKMQESFRVEIPEPIKSPTSDASQNAAQCLICFDNVPDAVFMECGHGGICYECSLEIWKATNECYLCRNKITQVLQVDAKAKIGNNVIKVLSSTQMVLYEDEA